MEKLSNSKIKELDLVELIVLCIKYKKVIITTLLLTTFIGFFLISISLKNSSAEINMKNSFVNILVNEDFLDTEGLIFQKSMSKWREQFAYRLNSSLNYEKWSKTSDLANYFLQIHAQKLKLSKYTTIDIPYENKDYLDGAVSYIRYTVKEQQNFFKLIIEKQDIKSSDDAKYNIKLLNKEIDDLLSIKSILDNKIIIITKFFETGELKKENYISNLISLESEIAINNYKIKTAKTNIASAVKSMNIKKDPEQLKKFKLFEVGTITPNIKPEKKLKIIQKYPLATYSIIIIINLFFFILLILFFRAKEEYEDRLQKK